MVAAADKDNSGFLDKQEFLGMVACQVEQKKEIYRFFKCQVEQRFQSNLNNTNMPGGAPGGGAEEQVQAVLEGCRLC